MRYLLILLLFCNTASFAMPLTLGLGGVRDINSLTKCRVITADIEPSQYLMLSGGSIFDGNDKLLPSQTCNVSWVGGGLVIRRDNIFDAVEYIRLNHMDSQLTSPYEFYIIFGLDLDNWEVSYRHISNGGTGGDNSGQDMFVLSYRWQ